MRVVIKSLEQQNPHGFVSVANVTNADGTFAVKTFFRTSEEIADVHLVRKKFADALERKKLRVARNRSRIEEAMVVFNFPQ